jgi:hypothetical protein
VAGPSGLVIVPGRRRERPGAATPPDPGTGAGLLVSAEVIEVRPGRTWALLVRRGAWEDSGEPADGLYWEGPPGALVQAVAETRDDLHWYQVGQPIAAPSLRLEGLGPWRLAGADR